MKVWLDGHIVEEAAARVSVTDHGLLYGDGIFEGIRVYGRKVFRLPDHLRRFAAAAAEINSASAPMASIWPRRISLGRSCSRRLAADNSESTARRTF